MFSVLDSKHPAHLMGSADSSICSPSMGLLCVPAEAATGLFAGASRKALFGIPIVSRLMDRDQYEWLRCRLRRILPLLELQDSIYMSDLVGTCSPAGVELFPGDWRWCEDLQATHAIALQREATGRQQSSGLPTALNEAPKEQWLCNIVVWDGWRNAGSLRQGRGVNDSQGQVRLVHNQEGAEDGDVSGIHGPVGLQRTHLGSASAASQ